MTAYNLLKIICSACSLVFFVADSDELCDPEVELHCPRCGHVDAQAEMNIECELDDE